jgi:hypothetical protein
MWEHGKAVTTEWRALGAEEEPHVLHSSMPVQRHAVMYVLLHQTLAGQVTVVPVPQQQAVNVYGGRWSTAPLISLIS